MTAHETDLLAELIRRKVDCLARLHDMGEKQIEFVRADRITELLHVLAAKQRVLIELQRIERELAPFCDQAPDKRQWRTSEGRRECAQQLEQCESLLGKIVAQEKESEGELIRRRDELAARLQGIHLASQARGAYTAQSAPDAGRLDFLSES